MTFSHLTSRAIPHRSVNLSLSTSSLLAIKVRQAVLFAGSSRYGISERNGTYGYHLKLHGIKASGATLLSEPLRKHSTNESSSDHKCQTHGYIELIVGPMFAGKSSSLLQRVAALEKLGRQVAIIKSRKDNRYETESVVTHNGLSKPCFAAESLMQFRSALKDAYHDFDVFAIDEAQFFPDLLEFCTEAADQDHKHVVIAGLDGDFRRRTFGQVLAMVPVADSIVKLSARCAYCSGKASFTLRIAADERQEVIGGADKYAPVCRHHFRHLSQIKADEELSAGA